MSKELFKVGIATDDIEKQTEYYKNVFGMKETARLETPDGDYVWLESNGVTIELMPHGQVPDKPVGFHHLCFKTEDIAAETEDAKAKGANVLAGPYDAGFGIWLTDIEGPDGVLIRLFHHD